MYLRQVPVVLQEQKALIMSRNADGPACPGHSQPAPAQAVVMQEAAEAWEVHSAPAQEAEGGPQPSSNHCTARTPRLAFHFLTAKGRPTPNLPFQSNPNPPVG